MSSSIIFQEHSSSSKIFEEILASVFERVHQIILQNFPENASGVSTEVLSQIAKTVKEHF